MRWLRMALMVGVVLVLPGHGVHAQGVKRSRVSVTCTCEDPTGQAYVRALRGALAKSARYREAGAQEDVAGNAIRISIVSLPLEPNGDGKSKAALSIVAVDDDGGMIHQFIETCTRIPIDTCAESMLTTLQKWQTPSAS